MARRKTKKDERFLTFLPDRDDVVEQENAKASEKSKKVDRCPRGGNHHWALRMNETDTTFDAACSKCEELFTIKKNRVHSEIWGKT